MKTLANVPPLRVNAPVCGAGDVETTAVTPDALTVKTLWNVRLSCQNTTCKAYCPSPVRNSHSNASTYGYFESFFDGQGQVAREVLRANQSAPIFYILIHRRRPVGDRFRAARDRRSRRRTSEGETLLGLVVPNRKPGQAIALVVFDAPRAVRRTLIADIDATLNAERICASLEAGWAERDDTLPDIVVPNRPLGQAITLVVSDAPRAVDGTPIADIDATLNTERICALHEAGWAGRGETLLGIVVPNRKPGQAIALVVSDAPRAMRRTLIADIDATLNAERICADKKFKRLFFPLS
jgi:hypothetical protein